MDNQQITNGGLRELALFAGAGGGILGGHLLGWRTICAAEWSPYPASVLVARQNEGILPPFPIWDDVQTFDGKPWRGLVDVVSGGFPCQDISSAGKGAGIDGVRSGMWAHMGRIIRDVQPRYVFVENSPMLTIRGLGRVLGDLASLGYNAKWRMLGAADLGADHKRERIWIRAEMANAAQLQRNGCGDHAERCMEHKEKSESGNNCRAQDLADANGAQRERPELPLRSHAEYSIAVSRSRIQSWKTDPSDLPESGVVRVVDELADGVDRLKAIGNGQVSIVAATAWRMLA